VILTVTLNAAIDRTVAVPNFRLSQRHRAVESQSVAGGKGVNVARALKLLGRPVIATGLTGGGAGARILEQLAEESILHDFTRIDGESRTNLSVVDPTTGEQTEINERGPRVTPEEIDSFVEKLLYLAQGATICVLAGSIPPGADPDVYARLVTELKALDVISVLDTDGEQMRAGLRAEPAVVAPNVREAEEVVGHEFNDPDDQALGLSGLIEMGAGAQTDVGSTSRSRRSTRSRASGPVTRFWPVTWQPATKAVRRATASRTAWHAVRNQHSTSARGHLTHGRSSGCWNAFRSKSSTFPRAWRRRPCWSRVGRG
jgi:1-phosphofructokinase family hexose kinase